MSDEEAARVRYGIIQTLEEVYYLLSYSKKEEDMFLVRMILYRAVPAVDGERISQLLAAAARWWAPDGWKAAIPIRQLPE